MTTDDTSEADDISPQLPPMHPGEVLREEFMVPLGLSAYAVAKACGVPRTRVERIAREEVGITGDSAVRLGRVFGIDPRFWLNLQADYELESALLALGPRAEAIKPLGRAEAA